MLLGFFAGGIAPESPIFLKCIAAFSFTLLALSLSFFVDKLNGGSKGGGMLQVALVIATGVACFARSGTWLVDFFQSKQRKLVALKTAFLMLDLGIAYVVYKD